MPVRQDSYQRELSKISNIKFAILPSYQKTTTTTITIGETGDGRYKIYILHHISLMKKLLHSILGLTLAHYVYYNLKHTKHENIN